MLKTPNTLLFAALLTTACGGTTEKPTSRPPGTMAMPAPVPNEDPELDDDDADEIDGEDDGQPTNAMQPVGKVAKPDAATPKTRLAPPSEDDGDDADDDE